LARARTPISRHRFGSATKIPNSPGTPRDGIAQCSAVGRRQVAKPASLEIPSRARTHAQHGNQAAELPQSVKPAYEVKETPDAWGVTVNLPGVNKEGLELTDGVLSVSLPKHEALKPRKIAVK